jgi:hypothetical protein
MLKETLGRGDGAGEPDPDSGRPATSGAETATEAGDQPATDAQRPARRLRARLTGLPALIGRHRLFSAALAVSIIPRVIVMLGFQPAVLFKLDSYDYLWDAVHLQPNPINPNGYSVFLWLLKPFHSLTLIAGIQHVLGLVAAVLVYAVMRRLGVRAWIATLASATILFDPAQFNFEQLIMADLLAMILMIMAFAVLLLREDPSLPRAATAGLLMGVSATVRPTTLPLIAFLAVFLLLRHRAWLKAVATVAAGALPVLAYMSWFAAVYGSFNLSNSNGLFLWSRTMSFANCSVIKPPAGLRALCLENQARQQALPPGSPRLLPKLFLWDHSAWQWNHPQTGVVPDTQAFTAANNDRALRFAFLAIKAQPIPFLHVVAHDVATPFIANDVFRFPGPKQPRSTELGPDNLRYAHAAVRAYTGSTYNIGRFLGHRYGTRLVRPWSTIIDDYQMVISMPGPLFALIVALGFAGLFMRRRPQRLAATLLWVSALVTVVLPIAEHEYTYRYVLPAVPLACMTAALVFARRAEPALAAAPAGPAAPRDADADDAAPAADPAAPQDTASGDVPAPAPDRPEAVSPA